jgi:hypothetical protein
MAEDERDGKKIGRLYIDVEYDPKVTDLESVADALDRVMDTALSTYGLLEEYGNPRPQAFYVETMESSVSWLKQRILEGARDGIA